MRTSGAVLACCLLAGSQATGCYVAVRTRPASAGYVVYEAPPPPRAMPVEGGAAPFAGAVWLQGHWAWNGRTYVWVDGRWVRGRPGYVLVQPRWVHRAGGWILLGAQWVPAGEAPGQEQY